MESGSSKGFFSPCHLRKCFPVGLLIMDLNLHPNIFKAALHTTMLLTAIKNKFELNHIVFLNPQTAKIYVSLERDEYNNTLGNMCN